MALKNALINLCVRVGETCFYFVFINGNAVEKAKQFKNREKLFLCLNIASHVFEAVISFAVNDDEDDAAVADEDAATTQLQLHYRHGCEVQVRV